MSIQLRVRGTQVDPRSGTAVVIPALLTLFGCGCIVAAVVMAVGSYRLATNGVHTPGSVINVRSKEVRDSDGRYKTQYTSTVRFSDELGNEHLTQINGKYRTGDQLELTYIPGKPESAVRATFRGIWGGPFFVAVFGLLFGGIGGAITYFSWQRRQEILWLDANGTEILARVIGVNEKVSRERKRHGRRRTVTTYTIVCQGPPPFDARYESHPISTHPGHDLIGRDIPVLIDPNDPKRYFVRI